MARVIAQGGTPPSPFRAALGQQAGGAIGQHFQQQQQQQQLNPFRELLQGELQGAQNPSLQQQMLLQAAQDPQAFQSLVGNPAGAVELAGQLGQQGSEPARAREVVVRGGDELNDRLGIGLNEGESATVKLQYDAQDNLLPGYEISNFRGGSGEGEDGNMFGRGREGRSEEYITELAPKLAEGKTTADEERRLSMAVANYLHPVQYENPDTGLIETRRRELPHFAREAFEQAGVQASEEGIHPMENSVAQRTPDPQRQQRNQAVAQQFQTVPPDLLPEPRQDETQPTVWELVEGASGPAATIAKSIHYLTGSETGARAAEVGTELRTIREQVLNMLRRNPRYSEAEADRLLPGVNIDPGALRSEGDIRSSLTGLDNALQRIEEEMMAVVNGQRDTVSGETRQHAMDTLNAIQLWRPNLMPPQVKPGQLEEVARTARPGQKILIDNGPGKRQTAHVFQRMQDAEEFAQQVPDGTVIAVGGETFTVSRDQQQAPQIGSDQMRGQ